MKKNTLNQDPQKYVFMTDPAFITYFGEHYEDAVIELTLKDEPVIQIFNLNGCKTSLPIERANYLLEKYYKLTGKSPAKQKKEVDTIPIDSYNLDIKLRVEDRTPVKKVANFATSE